MYAVPKEHRNVKFLRRQTLLIPQKLDLDSTIKKDAQELQVKEQLCTISKPLISERRFQVKKNASQECITAQHEAMIRYIHSSWQCIKQELDYSHKTSTGNDNQANGIVNGNHASCNIRYINGCTSSSIPKNFVPFDLESFWGQRIYQNLLQSS